MVVPLLGSLDLTTREQWCKTTLVDNYIIIIIYIWDSTSCFWNIFVITCYNYKASWFSILSISSIRQDGDGLTWTPAMGIASQLAPMRRGQEPKIHGVWWAGYGWMLDTVVTATGNLRRSQHQETGRVRGNHQDEAGGCTETLVDLPESS